MSIKAICIAFSYGLIVSINFTILEHQYWALMLFGSALYEIGRVDGSN